MSIKKIIIVVLLLFNFSIVISQTNRKVSNNNIENKEKKSVNLKILESIDFMDDLDTIYIPLHQYVYPKEERVQVHEINFTGDLELKYYQWAYKKIHLNDSIYSVIMHPDWLTDIVNFNSKGESVSFLTTTEYSGQSIVVDKEIICNQGYGYPYNSYKKFKVDDKGLFQEVESYLPSSEKLIENKRFNYILNKIPELKHKGTFKLNLLNEDFFRDHYPHNINIKLKKDISVFIKLFLVKAGRKEKIEKLIRLLKKEELDYLSFQFKITTEKYTVISLDVSYEIEEEISPQIIFLCYDRQGNLNDLFFTNPEDYRLKNITFSNNLISIEKEENGRVRFPVIFYEKVLFNMEKGQFKVIKD